MNSNRHGFGRELEPEVCKKPPFAASYAKSAAGDAFRCLLSVKKAADYLGRTEKAIRRLYKRGMAMPVRFDGRAIIDGVDRPDRDNQLNQ